MHPTPSPCSGTATAQHPDSPIQIAMSPCSQQQHSRNEWHRNRTTSTKSTLTNQLSAFVVRAHTCKD